MRGRYWLVGLAGAGAMAGLFGGCGGTTRDIPADAGADATSGVDAARETGGPADTGTVVDSGAPPCESDADLVNTAVPDASLGEGGSTAAVCVGCVRTRCASQLAACQNECECRRDIAALFACLNADGGSQAACASLVLSSTSQNALPLGGCLIAQCQSACATGAGGTDAGGDGGTDAGGGG